MVLYVTIDYGIQDSFIILFEIIERIQIRMNHLVVVVAQVVKPSDLCLQLRQEGEEVSTSSDNSESDSDDDGAEGGADRMQCQTS